MQKWRSLDVGKRRVAAFLIIFIAYLTATRHKDEPGKQCRGAKELMCDYIDGSTGKATLVLNKFEPEFGREEPVDREDLQYDVQPFDR